MGWIVLKVVTWLELRDRLVGAEGKDWLDTVERIETVWVRLTTQVLENSI